MEIGLSATIRFRIYNFPDKPATIFFKIGMKYATITLRCSRVLLIVDRFHPTDQKGILGQTT